MKISILKWEKHNPRKDYKTLPWFKVSSRMYRDPKIRNLSLEGKWLWICLLSIACEENKNGLIECDLDWLSEETRFSVDILASQLKIFQEKYLIDLDKNALTNVSFPSNERISPKSRSLHNEQNRTEQNEHNTRSRPNPTDADRLAAAKWAAFAKTASKTVKPDEAKWAEAIFELRRKANLSDADVLETLAWIEKDEFWRPNALSPAGLLRTSKSNGLRKIDNIRARMAEAKPVVRSTREAFADLLGGDASGS